MAKLYSCGIIAQCTKKEMSVQCFCLEDAMERNHKNQIKSNFKEAMQKAVLFHMKMQKSAEQMVFDIRTLQEYSF